MRGRLPAWPAAMPAAAAAVLAAALAVSGCQFAIVPPKSHPHATTSAGSVPMAGRMRDAPALLVQCAINRAGLRPTGQDWLTGTKVTVNSTNAANFDTWFRAHDYPGPYPQTFVIDGHRTHYLAFGATWVFVRGQWVPQHRAPSDPIAEQTSLYGWSLWAAEHDRLPPEVCGTGGSVRRLQDQVFGSAGNPW